MDGVDPLDWASLALVIIGALNWGLVGLGGISGTELNLVELTVGRLSPLASNIVYLLVGAAGLYQIYFGYELFED